MKVLLLSCNTGMGHNSAAQAIQGTLREQGVDCDTLDFLQLISPKAAAFISAWHTRIYRHMPKAFAAGYSLAEIHPRVLGRRGSVAYGYLAQGRDKLYLRLRQGGYGAVLCVHPLAATMVTCLQRKYRINARTFFVATDYTCSPPTGESDLDGYFIPHEGLWAEFTACGVPGEKIIPTGIPVRGAFYEAVDKQAAKALLGLPLDKRNVLLMCGSMGCGPIDELAQRLAELLPPDAILSVVCGTNEKLLGSLSKHGWGNVRLFGYTKEIPLLMDSAEIFLTKPGGISISEAAAKALPMVLIDAVGGCEKYNLAYFTSRGWAQTADTPAGIAQACADLLEDRAVLGALSARLAAGFTGRAAMHILSRLLLEKADPMPARKAAEGGALRP